MEGPWGPRGSGRGAGPSSAAGDLLELFVESVRLLASLCQERHEGNIALVRSLKGTTYKVWGLFSCVCFCDTCDWPWLPGCE